MFSCVPGTRPRHGTCPDHRVTENEFTLTLTLHMVFLWCNQGDEGVSSMKDEELGLKRSCFYGSLTNALKMQMR